jgi:hypothetical protein
MNLFKSILFGAAVLTSFSCSVLLFRGFKRKRIRMLMWSGLCFAGLTVNNIALFLDLVIFPEVDLRLLRFGSALVGMLFLLYGFVGDTDEMGDPL